VEIWPSQGKGGGKEKEVFGSEHCSSGLLPNLDGAEKKKTGGGKETNPGSIRRQERRRILACGLHLGHRDCKWKNETQKKGGSYPQGKHGGDIRSVLMNRHIAESNDTTVMQPSTRKDCQEEREAPVFTIPTFKERGP